MESADSTLNSTFVHEDEQIEDQSQFLQLMNNTTVPRRSSNQKVTFAKDVAKGSSDKQSESNQDGFELKQQSCVETEIAEDDNMTQASEKAYDTTPPDRAVTLTHSLDYSDPKLRQGTKRHDERPIEEHFSYLE